MKYQKMKKEELVALLNGLTEKASYFNDWQISARQNMDKLEKIETLKEENANYTFKVFNLKDEKKSLKEENASLVEEIELRREEQRRLEETVRKHSMTINSLEEENASLADTASKRLETIKKRIEKGRKRENEREDVITGLFNLYQTILLEDSWNDRVYWKNQVLEEVQYLIRYIG